MRYLKDVLPPNVDVVKFNAENLQEYLKKADVVVGAVLTPGAKAPKFATRDMLKLMKKGAVIVDVAVDQGGIFETTKPTFHSDPVYEVDGIIHYCVANMPGAYPLTSTLAITSITLPYALEIANKGWKKALKENLALRKGLNMAFGKVTHKGVAEAFGLEYYPPETFL
jgi:alanine dehydrogenase